MVSLPRDLLSKLTGEVADGLPSFCLERWQSLHETAARINLSESGVYPLTLAELRDYGVDLEDLGGLELGYGWTRGSPELREAISELYGGTVPPENIVVTAGSAEANLVTVLSLVRENDVVLVDMPNYMQVVGLLRWVGAEVVYIWRQPPDWRFPLQEALELVSTLRPKALFVNDPNNPTGSYMTHREIEELVLEASRLGTTLVFDEVYWGTERGEPKVSVVQASEQGNLISVSGLSKTYGLPGLRIGWVAASSRRISELAWSVKDYTSIAPSVLSDKIASLILKQDVVVKLRDRARRVVEENMRAFLAEISGKELFEPYPAKSGAFIWVRVPWVEDTLGLAYTIYKQRGVLLVPGECFEMRGYMRIGLGMKPEHFRVGLRELVESMDSLKKELTAEGR